MRRRSFLKATATAAALPFGGCGIFRLHPPMPFSFSLAQWSLHRTLFAGELGPLDFPAAARGLGFDAVEYVNQFFADKADNMLWLGELRRRAESEGVNSLLIMCDGEGRLGEPEADARGRAVANHDKWLDAAAYLGCHAIRVNADSEGGREEQERLAADGLRQLCERADPLGLSVLVENHGGLSSDGGWLAGVMRRVDHPRIGTLPDFGNFHLRGGREYDRYRGVEELMPFARAVSAKSHAFDALGNETSTDYARMLRIVFDSGYRGYIGVEYEGPTHPEDEGIRLTLELLGRTSRQLVL